NGPVVIDMAADEDWFDRGGECRETGTDNHSDHEVCRRFMQLIEPRGPTNGGTHRGRVEHRHQTIADERGKSLQTGHSTLELCRNVSGQNGGNGNPPFPLRDEEERAKKYHVGWPEWCELVRQRAEVKSALGTNVVRQTETEGERHGRRGELRPEMGRLQRDLGVHSDRSGARVTLLIKGLNQGQGKRYRCCLHCDLRVQREDFETLRLRFASTLFVMFVVNLINRVRRDHRDCGSGNQQNAAEWVQRMLQLEQRPLALLACPQRDGESERDAGERRVDARFQNANPQENADQNI